MTDTLHGLPKPESVAVESERELSFSTRMRILFEPVQQAWDQRAADMLAVLADSNAARVEIRAAVRTIRLCAWCGVLALLLIGVSVWRVLEQDRAEQRRVRELDQQALEAQLGELGRRVSRACGP